MSGRTIAQHAAIDFVMLATTGHVRRELFAADRRRWHAELRRQAREHGLTVECGHHGSTAWAVAGYHVGEQRPAAVAFRDRL